MLENDLMDALASAKLTAQAFGKAFVFKAENGLLFVTRQQVCPFPWRPYGEYTLLCTVKDTGEVTE